MLRKKDVFSVLKERGYVYQVSDEASLRRILNSNQPITLYQGFDPTAASLHFGHLESLMVHYYLQQAGHRVIFLLGGGTGMVGDPTDKATSRKALSPETVRNNAKSIKAQVEEIGLLRFNGRNKALMLNNYDWLSRFTFLEDFLATIARHFSVNELVNMRTFSDRLNRGEHLSLLEFCYPVLQSWDFLHLFNEYDCVLQIGGQDQWGNITQGIDLVRTALGQASYALTFPLITKADGTKMGKSESGTVWLSPELTTPFDFYQYVVTVPDEVVEQMFRLLTFVSLEEIAQIMAGHPRDAQQRLAYEITKIVHGEDAANHVREASASLFSSRVGSLGSVPEYFLAEQTSLATILISAGCLQSKSEIRRRCDQGAVSVDGKKVDSPFMLITSACLIKYGRNSFLRVTL